MPSTGSILLIDDSQDDIDLTVRAFKRHAPLTEVLIAPDGASALGWIDRWHAGAPWPMVILLDIRMPGVGGLPVLQTLKSDRVLRAIPVVILSTSRAARDVEAAYASGANSYLVKPVNYDEFLDLARVIAAYWLNANEAPCETRTAHAASGERRGQ